MRLVHTRNNRRVLRGRYAANGYAPALLADFPSQFYMLNGLEVGFSDIFTNSGGSLTAAGWSMDSTAGNTLTIAAAKLSYSATAMSLQLSGSVDYTDNNNGAEVEFLYWDDGTTDYIAFRLSTVDARTGQPLFVQRASSVIDAVTGASDAYSPPSSAFNLASRNGATFIQGAVDGATTNTNSTPTALPDLSAVDLSIGTTFTGTISRFIMWDVDIGDAGIAAASA